MHARKVRLFALAAGLLPALLCGSCSGSAVVAGSATTVTKPAGTNEQLAKIMASALKPEPKITPARLPARVDDTTETEPVDNEPKFDAVFSEDEVEGNAGPDEVADGDSESELDEGLLPDGEPEPEPSNFDAVFSADEVERFAVTETALPTGPLPLFGAILLQRVDNFEGWRATFDARLQERKRAGFVAQGVMRGVYDSKLVAVWLAVTDVSLAKAFFVESGLLRRARSGAAAKTRLQLSRNVAARMDPERQGLSAGIVALRVKELAPFRAAFEADWRARRAAGVLGYALSQDVDDESLVYLYVQSEQPNQLKRYVSARRTRQLWSDAGVTGISSVTVVREGELTLCQ